MLGMAVNAVGLRIKCPFHLIISYAPNARIRYMTDTRIGKVESNAMMRRARSWRSLTAFSSSPVPVCQSARGLSFPVAASLSYISAVFINQRCSSMAESDPVAAKSGFLCMYMSNHPDTLVSYVKCVISFILLVCLH
jgi:hypothetical protein